MSAPVFRFAPSPNGRLHLGHAYSALLNARWAAERDGTWLLRMEDIDPVRATPERIAGIEDDLAWLGLDWPRPVRQQSEHMAEYREGASRFRAQGLLFPCFCTRGEVAAAIDFRDARTSWPRDPDGSPVYPGTCRGLSPETAAARIASGEPHAWRLNMAAALDGLGSLTWTAFEPDGSEHPVLARPERWGDVVLVRRDVPTSYHLSVVLDDHRQGVTHVVRGRDLKAATDIHAVMAARLGLVLPLHHHHALVTDSAGGKLSKSRGSDSLASMRAAGTSAASVRRGLGFD